MHKNLITSLQTNVPMFDNDKQALLYTTLLRTGTLGAEKLHQQTKLHRESIQRELKKMVKNGTATFTHTGRVKRAKAVPIATLQETLEQKTNAFNLILKPLLEVESLRNKLDIQVIQDSHDFGALQLKLMKLQPPGHVVRVISAQPKAWLGAMIEAKKMKQSEDIRIKKVIPLELLCFADLKGEAEDMNREYFASEPKDLKRKQRYVEAELSSPMQIQIWHNQIVISIFQITPSVHICIENPQIVKAMNTYFSVLWKIGSL